MSGSDGEGKEDTCYIPKSKAEGFMVLFAFIKNNTRNRLIVCCSWGGINVLFEFGQLIQSNQIEALTLPSGNRFVDYFVHGTFSSSDIFAAILGAVLSLMILKTMES